MDINAIPYKNMIDTDAAIGSILSNFETSWIMHTVNDALQLQFKFRPYSEPSPNFVDIVNRQLDNVLLHAPKYADKINEVKIETNREIIDAICNYYNLEFVAKYEELHPLELFGVAHTLYDIFISRFTDYMIDFFISYILRNEDAILASLPELTESNGKMRKPKEWKIKARNFTDPKHYAIHMNLNVILYNITSHDISFDTLLDYFIPGTYGNNRIAQLVVDRGDFFKNYYASLIMNSIYGSDILTVIKLKLQVYTQEMFSAKVKEEDPKKK